MKNIANTIDELIEAIDSFQKSGWYKNELSIYAPIWFKEVWYNESMKLTFVARAEPFSFSDIKITTGYENFLIVSNSKVYNKPDELKSIRIEIL
jgi:hypothetical protein